MSKDMVLENFSLTPSSLNIHENSYCKTISGDKCFIFENVLTRRNSQHKGKKMIEIKKQSQELAEKIKILENRVKHIENTQQKTQRNIQIAKEKF